MEQIGRDVLNLLGALLVGYQTFALEPAGTCGRILVCAFYAAIGAALVLLALFAVGIARFQLATTAEGPLARRALDGPRRFPVLTATYLVAWLGIPLVLCLEYSLSYTSLWGVPRYLVGSAPALHLLLAAALCWARRWLAVIVATLMIVTNLAILGFYCTHHTRTPWKEISRVILEAQPVRLADVGESACCKRSVVVTWLNRVSRGRAKALEHALRCSAGPRCSLDVRHRTLDEALKSHEPILTLFWGEWSGSPDDMRWPGRLRKECCRRMVFGADIHEEPFTALPTPYRTRRVEIWVSGHLMLPSTRISFNGASRSIADVAGCQGYSGICRLPAGPSSLATRRTSTRWTCRSSVPTCCAKTVPMPSIPRQLTFSLPTSPTHRTEK